MGKGKDKMEYLIGIDLGTSGAKIVLFSSRGKTVCSAMRSYSLYQPKNGWAEQAPEDWWNAVADGLSDVLSQSGVDASLIRGIGLSGQMHGLVLLDHLGCPLRRAIIWCDQRSQEECVQLEETLGQDRLLDITGNPALPGFTASKILWVQNHEPHLWEKCAHILLPKDYIRYQLTGELATDVSDASGMLLFDVKNRCWSKEMCEICGITEDMLAGIYESYEKVGCVKEDLAKELGLTDHVAVAAGAGDNAAAAVGTGTVGEGRCNISLGTSGTIFISSKNFRVDSNNALHAFAHADGTYHLMGCMLSAASCNKWWMEDILNTQDFGKEQEPITAEKLGANDVYYLPYLMGERSPHNDPAARGSFIGLRMDSTRADMTQAVLEGVAFAIKDCVEIARAQGVEIASSTLCGGGAKSPLWREIMANILGIPLALPQTEQGPGYGGAMLAAVACGEYATVQECADKLIKIKSVTEPDPALVKKYAARYELWHKLYPALKPLYAEMEALQ